MGFGISLGGIGRGKLLHRWNDWGHDLDLTPKIGGDQWDSDDRFGRREMRKRQW